MQIDATLLHWSSGAEEKAITKIHLAHAIKRLFLFAMVHPVPLDHPVLVSPIKRNFQVAA